MGVDGQDEGEKDWTLAGPVWSLGPMTSMSLKHNIQRLVNVPKQVSSLATGHWPISAISILGEHYTTKRRQFTALHANKTSRYTSVYDKPHWHLSHQL